MQSGSRRRTIGREPPWDGTNMTRNQRGRTDVAARPERRLGFPILGSPERLESDAAGAGYASPVAAKRGSDRM
jgi:hypothetical protein